LEIGLGYLTEFFDAIPAIAIPVFLKAAVRINKVAVNLIGSQSDFRLSPVSLDQQIER
jgi:hypothetical protein